MTPLDAFAPVYEQFAAVAGMWYATLFDYANQLFLMLATLEIGLGAIQWMVAQQSHDFVAMGMFRKVMWIGFMYAVLLHSQTWIPAVINSFVVAGSQAAGITALNPGEVFMQGLALMGSLLSNLVGFDLLTKPASMLMGLFAAVIIFLAFCAISFQLALTLMETYIVTGGGVLLLGFGSFRGTAAITEKYFSYVIGVGVKLFVLYLIIGTGVQLTPMWQAMIDQSGFFDMVSRPLAIAGAAMLYGLAAWMLPSLASSMLAGSVGFGLHETIGTGTMAARLSLGAAAAPAAAALGAGAAAGIAKATAASQGGGIGGAMKGLSAGGAALGREARNAAVPKLGRAIQNLQYQRSKT